VVIPWCGIDLAGRRGRYEAAAASDRDGKVAAIGAGDGDGFPCFGDRQKIAGIFCENDARISDASHQQVRARSCLPLMHTSRRYCIRSPYREHFMSKNDSLA